ncbi:ribonuclease H protein [Canna indica]|uniref:Ribonuclease H protein n=1 Tax=Canna indica TaxID=4628 RepID=A0AAQ3JPW9_9LILI|nr:ribonuclease H protein [Canna indica]
MATTSAMVEDGDPLPPDDPPPSRQQPPPPPSLTDVPMGDSPQLQPSLPSTANLPSPSEGINPDLASCALPPSSSIETLRFSAGKILSPNFDTNPNPNFFNMSPNPNPGLAHPDLESRVLATSPPALTWAQILRGTQFTSPNSAEALTFSKISNSAPVKHKYPKLSIANAEPHPSCSWSWRLFVKAFNKLSIGFQFIIISGNNTSFMHDPWILDLPFNRKPTFINIHLINDALKVNYLIKNQQWDEALCNDMFSLELGASISMIGLPLTPHDDKLIWTGALPACHYRIGFQSTRGLFEAWKLLGLEITSCS